MFHFEFVEGHMDDVLAGRHRRDAQRDVLDVRTQDTGVHLHRSRVLLDDGAHDSATAATAAVRQAVDGRARRSTGQTRVLRTSVTDRTVQTDRVRGEGLRVTTTTADATHASTRRIR